MIFFTDNNGTIIRNFSEPVYQGSANTNTIYLIAPFAENALVTVAFTLPNGARVGPYKMTQQSALTGITDASGQTYSGWTYSMPNNITQFYGTVGAQFYFHTPGGVLTATSLTSFEVKRGVAPDLPQTPDADVYEEILENLAQIQTDLANGVFVARSVFPWRANASYNANEVVFYPYVGNYGAFVMSVQNGNTNHVPYSGDMINASWWSEVVNFNTISSDFFGQIVDQVNAAAGYAQQAAQSAQTAQDAAEETAAKVQDALQESVTQAQDAATAAQGSANDALEAAQEAKDAALTIGQSAGKQVHFVTSTADMTQEGELYAMVTDSDANLFALYIVQNGTPVYAGSANIVVPTMDYFFATLSPAGWSANRQTVSLQDATPTSETTVIPVDTDAVEYVLCGVRATSVSSGSMTFACDSVPQNNITVIIGVFTEVDLPNASDYYTSAQVDEKISTVDSKITAETSAREAADEQLRQSIAGFQGSVSAETAARQQADQQLQSSIDAVSQDLTEETTARQSADGTLQQSITALQTELSNETQQRQSADNTFTQNISSLQTSLSTETQQRQSADSAMQQDISQLQSDVQGILEDAATKEHFRGYYNTTAEIQSIPNPADGDYAWNAQTGTVWNYTTAWADSNVPVPDKTVEKSSAAPLMDGTASAGSSNQYAAGDHRHPTDTTRAAAADLSAEITAREQGDTALQTAVGNVQSALTTETQQRQAADTQISGNISDLQTGLSTETQNRTNADTTLQNNINSEASARQQADNALSARIDDIEDGTTGIGTAQKVQNALTLTVNGETTVFDGSAARSVAIDCVQYVDVSIDTSRWSGTSATLTSSDFAKLSYVTTSNLVQFVPSDGSAAMIWDSEVALSAQAAGSITFTCTSTPSAAVSGTVIIYN